MISRYPGIEALRGSAKGNWIEDHLAEIQQYYSMHGREATKQFYCLSDWTMDYRILDRTPTEKTRYKYYDSADIVAQIAREEARSASVRCAELERQYQLFTTYVSKSLVDGFFKPLLRRMIKLPPEMELTDQDCDEIGEFFKLLEKQAQKLEKEIE